MKLLLLILSFQVSCLSLVRADDKAYSFAEMENIITKHFVDSNSSASCQTKTGEAQKRFNQAAYKIVDVNNWAKLIGMPGQKFQLYSGRTKVTRPARVGDLIRIKLPLDPTLRSYWVRIEVLKRKSKKFEDHIFMVVKPTANPFKNRIGTDITDHFFTNEATNTFFVSMVEGKITSRVSGRYEEANLTQVETEADGVANYTIAQMGWGVSMNDHKLGFQSLLWSKLNNAVATCD